MYGNRFAKEEEKDERRGNKKTTLDGKERDLVWMVVLERDLVWVVVLEIEQWWSLGVVVMEVVVLTDFWKGKEDKRRREILSMMLNFSLNF